MLPVAVVAAVPPAMLRQTVVELLARVWDLRAPEIALISFERWLRNLDSCISWFKEIDTEI